MKNNTEEFIWQIMVVVFIAIGLVGVSWFMTYVHKEQAIRQHSLYQVEIRKNGVIETYRTIGKPERHIDNIYLFRTQDGENVYVDFSDKYGNSPFPTMGMKITLLEERTE